MRYLRVQARRLGRRYRRPRGGGGGSGRQPGRPWWETSWLEIGALERGLPDEYAAFQRCRIGNALVYQGSVQLEPFGCERRLTIIFPGLPSRVRSIVMASGPVRSRHRFTEYRPTSLCLWYAGDHESLRWTPRDGLVSLIDLTRVHLVREAWWRETGLWLGPEVHRPPSPRGHSRTDQLRRARTRCWCASGRAYAVCHGALPEDVELELLGIAGTSRSDLGVAA